MPHVKSRITALDSKTAKRGQGSGNAIRNDLGNHSVCGFVAMALGGRGFKD